MEVKLFNQALMASQWQVHASCNSILIAAILEKLTLECPLVSPHSIVFLAKSLKMSSSPQIPHSIHHQLI